MCREGRSNGFKLLGALFLLVVLTLPTAVSCKEEEESAKGTPTAAATEVLLDPVKTDAGYVSGTTIGEPGKEVRIYRGIPYAAPPVGDLRWKPPQPVEPWSGILECTAFRDSAVQPEVGFAPGPKSEDSLYVNVLTPAKKTSERLPVLVWFHGGGYSIGPGNQPPYTWPSLSQHGAILVSVNHRLGPIGLLALPALSEESPNGVSGNYMFLDLIASLEWVQTNIAAFGGDPNNVTIFGESGGGGKADALVASPLAKGLFHRAIYESGANVERPGGRRTPTLAEAEALGEQLVAKLGVPADDLAALRAVPAEKIIEAGLALAREMNAAGRGYTTAVDTLVVDGWFMPDTPTNIFAQDKQNNVPILLCANIGELIAEKSFLVVPELLRGYVKRLESTDRLGTNGYAAIFTQVPSNWKEDGVLANHGLEVPYVFGALEVMNTSVFFEIFEKPSGAVQQDPGLTEDDEKVADAMMTMWAQFAKTGDPSVEGLIDWPTWDPASDQYLDIAWPLEVKTGYSKIVPEE
jgi:para-nitrobenzyl esterase